VRRRRSRAPPGGRDPAHRRPRTRCSRTNRSRTRPPLLASRLSHPLGRETPRPNGHDVGPVGRSRHRAAAAVPVASGVDRD
jgi:hypothetical protein